MVVKFSNGRRTRTSFHVIQTISFAFEECFDCTSLFRTFVGERNWLETSFRGKDRLSACGSVCSLFDTHTYIHAHSRIGTFQMNREHIRFFVEWKRFWPRVKSISSLPWILCYHLVFFYSLVKNSNSLMFLPWILEHNFFFLSYFK